MPRTFSPHLSVRYSEANLFQLLKMGQGEEGSQDLPPRRGRQAVSGIQAQDGDEAEGIKEMKGIVGVHVMAIDGKEWVDKVVSGAGLLLHPVPSVEKGP